MIDSNASLPDVIADGRWLSHRYDETNDVIHFRLVPKDAHRALTFLTDQEIGDAPLVVFNRADCLKEARKHRLPEPRFIFHSAYCCSTMLARAFDVPGVSFGLKEPQILNDVVGLQLRRADPRQVAAALDIALLLLARPLDPGEVNVIKPSNLLNPLLPLLQALRPHAPALLLYAPLETFLISVARKGIEGRSWVRELMWKFILLGQAERFGFTDEELYRQTDLQAGASGWLAQLALFAEAATASTHFRTVESETLIEQPTRTMEALAALFEISLDAREIIRGPAFQTNSKDRAEYSAEQRRRDYDAARDLHQREISIVVTWAEKVAHHVGLKWTLPRVLLA